MIGEFSSKNTPNCKVNWSMLDRPISRSVGKRHDDSARTAIEKTMERNEPSTRETKRNMD